MPTPLSFDVETDLPYKVVQVIQATDTAPETRTLIAAFHEATAADWFTDQCIPTQPGIRFECAGLEPNFPGGLVLPTSNAEDT